MYASPNTYTKTKINPLKRMGQSPGVRLPLLSYKSELLTPKAKACHHLLAEGSILFKAINRK